MDQRVRSGGPSYRDYDADDKVNFPNILVHWFCWESNWRSVDLKVQINWSI
jgi:hypothetical protein